MRNKSVSSLLSFWKTTPSFSPFNSQPHHATCNRRNFFQPPRTTLLTTTNDLTINRRVHSANNSKQPPFATVLTPAGNRLWSFPLNHFRLNILQHSTTKPSKLHFRYLSVRQKSRNKSLCKPRHSDSKEPSFVLDSIFNLWGNPVTVSNNQQNVSWYVFSTLLMYFHVYMICKFWFPFFGWLKLL